MVAATLIAIVVGIGAVMVISPTRQTHEYVKARITDLLTPTYRGRITIGAIHGSFLGDLEIRDILVSQDEVAIFRVPVAKVRYALFPLVRGRVRLATIELVHPWM